ncbi:hypothetical protein NEPAR06_0449 [Nematocida parisii]|uniref:uncharacterized protein n=1 Tax=Nematocida parisii (strain ERTm1 / ATCC PRA-289) TaxID=881290 RepID=UPI000264B3F3|nr:uncharacterized protein NEPG_01824 [Nematocida parisii ERTm1]EIJ93482.1 hypothetical protein NEPG_01824 [Nematocida parisii ERTm1]KAI5153441.1 hypothetical protein NEPAR06_0449 [Nematocida parisii]KAI5156229.1 hypothetical protein NEPAR05_0406 [Nematocida parisii]|eukprot:XP_013059652.1 hypothetical protein NEPG_01824 [Nematocida parisii ERTm1]
MKRTQEETRERNKRRLKQLNKEISLLEQEKEMNSNVMLELETKIKTRQSRRYLITEDTEYNTHSIQSNITPEKISSLEVFIHNISNLPLEYILLQSNKIVLTKEWYLSYIEREYLVKYNKIKELLCNKLLLEEKTKGIFTGVEKKRREIIYAKYNTQSVISNVKYNIQSVISNKYNTQSVISPLGSTDLLSNISNILDTIIMDSTSSISSNQGHISSTSTGISSTSSGTHTNSNQGHISSTPTGSHSTHTPAYPSTSSSASVEYKRVLSLFSMMKSNKSSVRYTIPPSKKSNSMHSSHSTCLDKTKGECRSIPDLVKYRMSKCLNKPVRYPAVIRSDCSTPTEKEQGGQVKERLNIKEKNEEKTE